MDFGKAMEHSPDGKAYLVAQGASDGQNRRFAYNSWITADQVYLVRVAPSIENMNDATQVRVLRRPTPKTATASGRAISPRSSRSPNGATTWAA